MFTKDIRDKLQFETVTGKKKSMCALTKEWNRQCIGGQRKGEIRMGWNWQRGLHIGVGI